MALLNKLNRLINIILPFSDFIYILQLEEYSTKRFLKWLPKFFFRRNIQVRQKLVFTKKVKLIYALSVLLYLVDLSLVIFLFHTSIFVALIVVLQNLSIPLYVLVSCFLVEEILFKRLKRNKRVIAKNKLSKSSKLKVIVIAGSFGKTTVKNFLYQLLEYSHKVVMIPGNINTPMGIANWINDKFDADAEVLLAEVDSYEQGEIANSMEILNADFAIITNIADQHLERFGNIVNLTRSLVETFSGSKTDAFLLANSDTISKINQYTNFDTSKVFCLEKDKHLLDFENEVLKEIDAVKKSLSPSNIYNLDLSLAIVNKIGFKKRFLISALQRLELPDRRQKVSNNIFGFEGIDDSYNICYSSAIAALERIYKLAQDNHKKIMVITAGIPELSKENQDKNFMLGAEISKICDFCFILKSDFARDLESGFKDNKKYKIVESLNKLIKHELANFDKNQWMILLQPELNDLYY